MSVSILFKRRLWLAMGLCAGLAGLSGAGACYLSPPSNRSGLRLAVLDASGQTVLERRWPSTDLTALQRFSESLPPNWTARLTGFLWVHEGTYAWIAKADGPLAARLAEQDLLTDDVAHDPARNAGRIALAQGFAPLELRFRPAKDTSTFARLRLAPVGTSPVVPPPDDLYPSPEAFPDRQSRLRGHLLWNVSVYALGLALICLLAQAAHERWQAKRWPAWFSERALPLLTVALGGLLRFQALVERTWHPDAPLWAERLALGIARFTSWGLRWSPNLNAYAGDPYSYLLCARGDHGFYDAFVREPVFVFATRFLLRLTGDQDISVALASAASSTLVVLALYLLGRVTFGPTAGLLAALLFAVEPQAIWWSVEGWRDETFTLFVTAAAAALVGLDRKGAVRSGILAGVVGGLACLTRITALSFLVPAYLLLALRRAPDGRGRRTAIVIACALTLAVIAPYLTTCTVAYGDPLYAINAHTRFYRGAQGLDAQPPMSWLSYLWSSRTPFVALNTAYVGLTLYPFESKWSSFRYLLGPLTPLLAGAAFVGLLILAFHSTGRLLLLLLFASLLPYAFTWDLPGGGEWRFTLHAYPFYLLAASFVTMGLLRGLRPGLARRLWAARRQRGVQVAGVVALATAFWIGLCATKYLRTREEVRLGLPTTILVGLDDWPFFGDGWRWPRKEGNQSTRQSVGKASVIRLPLEPGYDYRLSLRLGRSCASAAPLNLRVAVNGQAAAEIAVRYLPDRMERYEVTIPKALVREGTNRVELSPTGPATADAPCPHPAAFALWHFGLTR
jgi:hypothetical protein